MQNLTERISFLPYLGYFYPVRQRRVYDTNSWVVEWVNDGLGRVMSEDGWWVNVGAE